MVASCLTSLASGELLKDEFEFPLDLCLLFGTVNSPSPPFFLLSETFREGGDARETRVEFAMGSSRNPPELREAPWRGASFSFCLSLLLESESLFTLLPPKERCCRTRLPSGSGVRRRFRWLPEPEAVDSVPERRPSLSLEGSRTEVKAGSDKWLRSDWWSRWSRRSPSS